MQRNDDYRTRSLACPECSGPLREQATEHANVDVCADCGGVFIEWFDGDPSRVAAGIAHPAPRAGERRGSGGCPICGVALTYEGYPDKAGSVVIGRCGECAGSFVSASALTALGALVEAGDDAPASDGFLDSVAKALRRWFGWDPPSN